jgi:hypothetical protein
MLPYDELEYGGIVEKMNRLEKRFCVRAVLEPVAVGK